MAKETNSKRPPLEEILKAKRFLRQELVGAEFRSVPPFEFSEYNWIANEKPEVKEAMTILARAGISISMSNHEYSMREEALCANIS